MILTLIHREVFSQNIQLTGHETNYLYVRVVILNQHPGLDFCVFLCFTKGSNWMDAPFFLKQQYFEDVNRENLFFPWRSLMSIYDPLYECKSRKYSLFWTEGNFIGKDRTPGERLPKCPKWTQWYSSKLLGPQHGLLSRHSFGKTRNSQKWHLFEVIFLRESR